MQIHQEKTVHPIFRAMEFVAYLKDHPGATYQDLGQMHGITRARVCQIISLVTNLPDEMINFLMNSKNQKFQKYFTERRLRPLTKLGDDKQKMDCFNKMKGSI